MSSKRLPVMIVLAVCTAGFSILFVTILQDGFRTALVEPLIEAFYIVRFYILRLPQQLLWVVAVLVASVLFLRTFWRAVGPLPRRKRHRIPAATPVDELERLAAAIHHARHRPFYQKRVVHEVAEIAVRLIARQEGTSLDKAKERLQEGTWPVDPTVRAFFRTGKRHRTRRALAFNEQLRHTLGALEQYTQGDVKNPHSRPRGIERQNLKI